MKRFLQFASFAAGTQFVLVLNQVLLLPLQVRLWGSAATAGWYASVALATLTTAADLGLRTAGHPDLLRAVELGDARAAEAFAQVWAWVRIILCGLTAGIITWEAARGSEPWALALTAAYAVETLLIIRIVYLDSLDRYRGAEASYFCFAALRLGLALPALLAFHCGRGPLGWLFLGTSCAGLVLQGLQTRQIPALRIFAPIPRRLSLQAAALSRYTVAEPCANWARLSLPVLVLAAIAPASAVTAFVGLRAVFGAGRTTIQQIARVGSVRFVRLSMEDRPEAAERLIERFLAVAGLAGCALSIAVIADHGRLLGLWLPGVGGTEFGWMCLAFGVTGAFFSFQVAAAVLFRAGRLRAVAQRQYGYVLYAAAFAGIGLALRSVPAYLALMAAAEVALAGSFLLRAADPVPSRAGQQSLLASVAGLCVIGTLWAAAHGPGALFRSFSAASMLGTAGTALAGFALLAGLQWAVQQASRLGAGRQALRPALLRAAGNE